MKLFKILSIWISFWIAVRLVPILALIGEWCIMLYAIKDSFKVLKNEK